MLIPCFPFFMELGRGRRTKTNKGKGVVFNFQYDLWQPKESDMAKLNERSGDLNRFREAYDAYARSTNLTYDHANKPDKNLPCETKASRRKENMLIMYLQKDGSDICGPTQLRTIWAFDEWLRSRQNKDGLRWLPDFCSLDGSLDWGQQTDKYKEICGEYRTPGGGRVIHNREELLFQVAKFSVFLEF